MAPYEMPLKVTGQASEWRKLASLNRVLVIDAAGHVRRRTVDTLASDGTTVWIFLDDGLGRIALTKGDSLEIQLTSDPSK